MTGADLMQFANHLLGNRPAETNETPREYVYGLKGIRDLFGVCHATAQRYKDTFLRPAIQQQGRKITVDVLMARDLFAKHR